MRCPHAVGAATDGARCMAEKALELEPTCIKALFRRGCAHANASDWNLARDDFQHVLRLEPGNEGARRELLKIKERRGASSKEASSREKKGSSCISGKTKEQAQNQLRPGAGVPPVPPSGPGAAASVDDTRDGNLEAQEAVTPEVAAPPKLEEAEGSSSAASISSHIEALKEQIKRATDEGSYDQIGVPLQLIKTLQKQLVDKDKTEDKVERLKARIKKATDDDDFDLIASLVDQIKMYS